MTFNIMNLGLSENKEIQLQRDTTDGFLFLKVDLKITSYSKELILLQSEKEREAQCRNGVLAGLDR